MSQGSCRQCPQGLVVLINIVPQKTSKACIKSLKTTLLVVSCRPAAGLALPMARIDKAHVLRLIVLFNIVHQKT